MKILDATCGMKSIWYQKNHPFVTFMDMRKGTYSQKKVAVNSKIRNDRIVRVDPDVISEWKDAPFPDNYFDMVVFDPPHLFSDRNKSLPALTARYGVFYKDNWKHELGGGYKEIV